MRFYLNAIVLGGILSMLSVQKDTSLASLSALCFTVGEMSGYLSLSKDQAGSPKQDVDGQKLWSFKLNVIRSRRSNRMLSWDKEGQ